MQPREQALALLASRISPGPPFFETAAQALALAVGCRWAGVGKLLHDGESVQILAFWDHDHCAEPFTFKLHGSPCHEVYRARPDDPHGFFPCDVAQRFPDFPLLRQIGARSYRGEVFHDTGGRPVGHVFVISEHDESDDPAVRDFFRLVSQRVGAEYNRFRAEEALAVSEQTMRWYEWMAATTSDRMAFIDRDYTYRAINQSYLDAINENSSRRAAPWTREDVIGRTVAEVLGEDFFRTEVQENLDRCFAGTELSVQGWMEILGGPRLYLDVRHHPYRDEDRQVVGAVSTVRDLTRHRQDQDTLLELSRNEALISGDLETAMGLITELVARRLEVERAGVWLLDNEGQRRLRCHDLYQRGEKKHSQGTVVLVDDFPRYFQALAEGPAISAHDALEDERTAEFRQQYLVPLGISSLLSAPIRISGEIIGVLCHEHVGMARIWQAAEVTFASEAADLIAQTVTHHERRALEQRLYQAQKMESLGVLAGGIAHDFNNLLVGVLGGSELALAKLSPTSDARQQIALVRDAALRASELCSQMLAYSGQGRFQLQVVDLSKVVEDTAHLLHASLTKRAVLRFRLTNDLPPIRVDVTQVRQIIMNLITNAAAALGEKDGIVTLETGVRLCQPQDFDERFFGAGPDPGSYVYLEVTDTGCGMNEETRQRIFDPFFSTKFTGRGLGLAAVLGIVRGHDGGIWIDSKAGQGTTIRVYFPTTVADLEEAADPTVTAQSERSRGTTALVIDDEEVVRLIASEMLRGAGFTVMTANDGREGVDVFEEHAAEIDIVILDVTMPRMSGQEAFEKIRLCRGDVPIVLASGYSEEDTIRRFNGQDVTGFLHKPFRTEQFLAILDEALSVPPATSAEVGA